MCDHPCLSELSERAHQLPAAAETEGEAAAGDGAIPSPAAAPVAPEEEEGKMGLEKLLGGSAKLAMLDRMLKVHMALGGGECGVFGGWRMLSLRTYGRVLPLISVGPRCCCTAGFKAAST